MRAWWLVALVTSCAAATVRAPAASPHAGIASNDSCIACHAREADEWRGSLHRQSFTNTAFQRSFALEPTTFCHDCHAPEKNEGDGIACVTCHLGEPGKLGEIVRAPSCGRCHEFLFPDRSDLMQATLREHAMSPAANKDCSSCHRGHAFAEVRDPAWLASRLRVSARFENGQAHITLSQTDPGHAFPTGDLFRRLAVTVGSETHYLGRRLELVPGHAGRKLTADERVFFSPVTLDVPVSMLPVRWSVTLQRVLEVGIGDQPAQATIESEVVLHAGVLGGATR